MIGKELRFKALIAEKLERFEEIVENMEILIKEKNGDLNEEEIELLSVGYKTIIDKDRSVIRALKLYQKKKKKMIEDKTTEFYLEALKKRSIKNCENFIEKIKILIKNTKSEDKKMLIQGYKMIADNNRYICEIDENKVKNLKDITEEYYLKAKEIGKDKNKNPSLLILTIYLNYSVFVYEVVGDKKRAYEDLKEKFEDTLMELNNIPEEELKNLIQILNLIEENLEFWKIEIDECEKKNFKKLKEEED